GVSAAPRCGCGSRKESLGAVSRPYLTLSISAGHRYLILLQRAWHEVLELVHTSRIGWVSRHQFRRLLAVLFPSSASKTLSLHEDRGRPAPYTSGRSDQLQVRVAG